MKARILVCFVMLGLLPSRPADATVVQITIPAFANAFSPDSVRVGVGDTVKWLAASGEDHTTTSGSGSADPGSGALWNGPLDNAHPSFQRQFSTPGLFRYYCTIHEIDGMRGVVVVTKPKTVKVTANDDFIGMYFSPDSAKIFEGDSILWQWISGAHTTTSGTGSADPQMGVLWNDSLNPRFPPFRRKFSGTGTFPYFCIPHEFDGMRGKVVVVSQPACLCDCHGDPRCDSITDVLDVVQGIGVAFRGAAALTDPSGFCPFQETDVDCNGITDILDVVRIISVAFRGGDQATVYCHPCP